MYDSTILIERLRMLRDMLLHIPRRFAAISEPADFSADLDGIDRRDAICMVLIAVGQELKDLDRKTEGKLLIRYPGIKWRGAMGVRDVLAHNYFQVNAEQLYDICQKDIPALIETIGAMIADIEKDAT